MERVYCLIEKAMYLEGCSATKIKILAVYKDWAEANEKAHELNQKEIKECKQYARDNHLDHWEEEACYYVMESFLH